MFFNNVVVLLYEYYSVFHSSLCTSALVCHVSGNRCMVCARCSDSSLSCLARQSLSLPQTCNADDTWWVDNILEGSILWGDDCRQHALLSSWTVDLTHKGGRKGGTFSCSK